MNGHPRAREDGGEAAPEDVPDGALVEAHTGRRVGWRGYVETIAREWRQGSGVRRIPAKIEKYEVEKHCIKNEVLKASG